MKLFNAVPDSIQGQLVSHGGWFAGAVLVFAGMMDVVAAIIPNPPPRLGIAVHGLQVMCMGAAMIAIAMKQKHSSDMMAQSEAEKRLSDPNLPNASSVPGIQSAIDKMQAGGAPPIVEQAIDQKRESNGIPSSERPTIQTPIVRGR